MGIFSLVWRLALFYTTMLEPGLQLNEFEVKTVVKYAPEITQVLNKAADTVLIRLINLRDL